MKHASLYRRAICVAWWLLGGAVVSAVVAWGCASLQSVPWERGLGNERYDYVFRWPREVPSTWPSAFSESRGTAIGVTMLSVNGGFVGDVGTRRCMIEVWEFGWPFRCLDWESRKVVSGSNMMDAGWLTDENSVLEWSYRHGITHPWLKPTLMPYPWVPRLPLRPMPLGFVTDAVFYASPLFAATRAPNAMRSGIRRRRGRCSACGYDLPGCRTRDARNVVRRKQCAIEGPTRLSHSIRRGARLRPEQVQPTSQTPRSPRTRPGRAGRRARRCRGCGLRRAARTRARRWAGEQGAVLLRLVLEDRDALAAHFVGRRAARPSRSRRGSHSCQAPR